MRLLCLRLWRTWHGWLDPLVRVRRLPAITIVIAAPLWYFLITAGPNAASAAPLSTSVNTTSMTEEPHRSVVERFAIHDGFDRLVFSGPGKIDVMSTSDGLSLKIRFSPSATVGTIPHCGRRLIAVTGGVGTGLVSLVAGGRVRTWHRNSLFVVDVFDPLKPVAATQKALIAPIQRAPGGSSAPPAKSGYQVDKDDVASREPTRSANDRVDAGKAVPSIAVRAEDVRHGDASLTTPSPQQSPSSPQGDNEPASTLSHDAVYVLSEAELPGPAILLPVNSKVGAAAFSRRGDAHIVFDQPQALDLSALKDNPAFGSAVQTMLPTGTDLHFHVPSTIPLHLVQHNGNWAVSLSPLVTPTSPLPTAGHMRMGVLVFDMTSPGRAVALEDSVTGGRLLVGTQRGAGQRVTSQHTAAELTVLPTWQGLVVEPTSDRVVLRATRDGYELSAADPPSLSMTWPEQTLGAWPNGRVMTRMFDIPNLSVNGQHRRVIQALQDVVSLPKAARFPARLRVAQAMLAEGLDVEAAAVVRTAVAEDPGRRSDPLATSLSAVAAWLSAEAGGVTPRPPQDTDRFGDGDEATMWRALLWPDQPETARQAAALATTWPLLARYPQNLRRLVLRPAAALLAAGGQDRALTAFLSEFPDSSLDVIRARQLQSHGETAESLALLGKVAQRSDRLARADAIELSVEERLNSGQLTPKKAAEILESFSYSWRGDDRELQLRRRVAQFYAQSGAWRAALKVLDDTETMFPDEHATLQTDQAKIVETFLDSNQAKTLNALDLVDLAEKASKLPSGPHRSRFGPILAEKLLALDLPDQAQPIISSLFAKATDPYSRAVIGLQLAELQAGRGEPSAALAILDECSDSGLTVAMVQDRALLRARLLASLGKPADALAILFTQPGEKAREAETTILEAQHDWLGAAGALGRIVEDVGFGALPDELQQQILIHAARDRSEAGDVAGLRQLRKTFARKFLSGPNTALFAVLTADPVRSTADLPRSASEIAAMHALPASLSLSAPLPHS